MKTYLFVLGRLHLLSIAELSSILPANSNYLLLKEPYLLVETELPDSTQDFLNRLGGVTKIIEVSKSDLTFSEISKTITSEAVESFKGLEGKIRYAICIETINKNNNSLLKKTLIETKKALKREGVSSRFINNNFANASTAVLLGEKILQKGAEFCGVELDKDKWISGKTVAIQDINNYSKRDFERPERDAKLGMLPPKLAQIMINLADLKPGDYLYDPFCGMGTVLMEGMLLGINVIGSDLQGKNIEKTERNMEWVSANFRPEGTFRLFSRDATQIKKENLPEKIKALVSETFLGPPVSHLPPASQIEANQSMIENLVFNALKAITPHLPSNYSIVFTIQAYRDGSHYLTLENLKQNLDKIGLKRAELIPETLIDKLKLPKSAQYSLIYERPDQVVCRELIKIVKA